MRIGVGGTIAISAAVVVNLFVIVGFALLALNSQRVSDQLTVWSYTPTADIEAHVARTTMTDEARFLFYASRAEIVDDETFDPICAADLDGDGILGCYLLDGRRIYIYDVTDDRLDGTEEVSSAHEMLHAAWDRMSSQQRTQIGALLEAEVASHSSDRELTDRLAFYARAEPGERLNELHSIVGTEFADVSHDLQVHFATYFTDRAQVIDLNQRSQAVIRQQIEKSDEILATMDALSESVDADYAVYNQGYDQLNLDVDDYNRRGAIGDFGSQAQSNAEYDQLLSRQAQLDSLYRSVDDRTSQYNDLNDELDDLSTVIDDLNAHLNIDPPRTTERHK